MFKLSEWMVSSVQAVHSKQIQRNLHASFIQIINFEKNFEENFEKFEIYFNKYLIQGILRIIFIYYELLKCFIILVGQ